MNGEVVERGCVVRIEGPMARVRTIRSEACGACSARGFCHPFDEKTNEILVKNTIGAEAGQEVQLIMSSSSLVCASLVVYCLPLCLVIALAVAGHFLAGETGLLSPETGLLIGVGLALFASFFVVRSLTGRLERSRRFEIEMVHPRSPGRPA
ncbi:MAG: SoxR reducing system RseC family protein [Candidatus Coatesbacteria bacterium]|nr:SoxR reducing system RseC family protein [Candidatus Coatesbacteria bacterium]